MDKIPQVWQDTISRSHSCFITVIPKQKSIFMAPTFFFLNYINTDLQKLRERLSVGTVPTDKMHPVGTVPTNEMHPVGTVPMDKRHPVETLFFLNLFL